MIKFHLFQVDATAVVEARFIENSAGYKGGAIHADEQSTSLSANEYDHRFAQFLPGNCFMLFGNENTSPAGSNMVMQYWMHIVCSMIFRIFYECSQLWVSMSMEKSRKHFWGHA